MKRVFHILTILSLVALTSLTSCESRKDAEQTTPVSETTFSKGNVSTTISTDIDKLGQLLNFKIYKPTKVKFKYTLIDNSGQGRPTVPGPSDWSLEAVLYFDSTTFAKLTDFDKQADYPSPNYNMDAFRFDWLDKEILNELENSNKNYHGHPDFFFGTTNGQLWYLDKKILITAFTT